MGKPYAKETEMLRVFAEAPIVVVLVVEGMHGSACNISAGNLDEVVVLTRAIVEMRTQIERWEEMIVAVEGKKLAARKMG